MKTLIISILLLARLQGVAQPGEKLTMVQDYQLVNKNWVAVGKPYNRPDTLTWCHGYHWKKDQIDLVQDFMKVDGQWQPSGKPYATPDTLTYVHALVRKNGKAR